MHKNIHTVPDFFPDVKQKFQHVHIDLTGPLPPNKIFRYLLTIIDRFSRWPEAIPLSSIKTEDIMEALITHWISKFGVPRFITSDRGPQFTSQIWRGLAEVLGVELNMTTPYHPQANGLVERFHRTLKASLMSSADDTTWLDKLPWTLLGLRSAIKLDSGLSPGEIVFGTQLNLPLVYQEPGREIFSMEQFPKFMAERIQESFKGISSPKFGHNSNEKTFNSPTKDLLQAEFVFVRDKKITTSFSSPYLGPYRVLRRFPKFFLLQIGDSKKRISIDRLKPAFTTTTKISSVYTAQR